MSSNFHKLTVSAVKKETENATTLSFSIPGDLKETFQYKAGQYLTLRFDYKGEDQRRAYSISSSPLEDVLSVTSKRVPGGKISNHINDEIKVGDVIDVMAPEGFFTIKLDGDQRKDYFFFAAGSGITPIYSIIKTILEEEPMSRCALLFGNTDENNIIYQDELMALEEKYKDQLTTRHILSKPVTEKPGGMTGFFKKAKTRWTGWQGRMNEEKIGDFFLQNPMQNKDYKCFICGPAAMIENVKSILESRKINADNLVVEYFGDAGTPDASPVAGEGIVKMKLNGKTHDFKVSKSKTILDAAIEAGHDVPYSCTSGACSTCVAKVHNGSATMDACYALDDDEIAKGYILTCQAHPSTPELEIEFE